MVGILDVSLNSLHAMKVLMISGDPLIVQPGTPVYERAQLQRKEVVRLDIYVWPRVHSLREIWRAAQANAYDVVTAQDPLWRGHLAWHLARRMHVRLNIQVHLDLAALPWLRRRFAAFHLRRADSIRVVSERLRKQVADLGARAPISVLPIYVDTAPFVNLTRRPHPRFAKTILWVGRFEPEKDPLRALAVLKEVRSAGTDVGLVMLGAGSLGRVVRTVAESLAPYVELPGWKDPAPYLASADVVLSTSKSESYGASIIEALAAGVPVVAPDVGVAKEAGAVVVPRSNLAAAVVEVLRNGGRGQLLLSTPSADEWAKRWRATLI